MHNLSLPYGFHVEMIKAGIETAFIIFKQLPPFCNSEVGVKSSIDFYSKTFMQICDVKGSFAGGKALRSQGL
jgi:hypothetical protein